MKKEKEGEAGVERQQLTGKSCNNSPEASGRREERGSLGQL